MLTVVAGATQVEAFLLGWERAVSAGRGASLECYPGGGGRQLAGECLGMLMLSDR